MSEQVTTVKTKSNAPWIMGIVGVALAVPNFLCSLLCSQFAKDFMSEADKQHFSENNVAIGVALTFGMFVLSFFGKSKISLYTGLIMLVGALYLIYLNITQLQILGLAEGVVFLFSAIFSMTNAKKAK